MNLISNGESLNYILVQIQAPFEKESDAFKAGFRTIDELGIDRIKRAAKKVRESNPMFAGDLGFKHYTLVEPTSTQIEKIEKFNPNAISGDSSLVDEFGVPTILATWLVRDGYGLTPDVQELDLEGYTAYYIDKHLYLVNSSLSSETIGALLDRLQSDKDFNPQNIVIYGYAFDWAELSSLKDSLQSVQAGEKNLQLNFDVRY